MAIISPIFSFFFSPPLDDLNFWTVKRFVKKKKKGFFLRSTEFQKGGGEREREKKWHIDPGVESL